MSVTITRTAWIDDDGTGTTGTVLNNAIKTDLYNQIDGALALLAQLTGGNSFTGTQSITGNVIGAAGLNVRNIAAGSSAYAQIAIGNDVDPNLGLILGLASTFASGLDMLPNGVTLRASGVGGLTCSATGAGAPIRYFTNNAERMRITPAGELLVNTTTNPNGNAVSIAIDQVVHALGVGIQNTNVANGLYFLAFYNSGGSGIGTVSQVNASSVAYNTTSDQRLKTDDGIATDLSALRALRVHDFTWTADGIRDRGIFAQEAHPVFPRAVTPGTDDRTDRGDLARPWGTDYSKFVPDLIVGWQQHAAALEALRAELARLTGSPA
jgi:hypothetical protein